MTDLQQIIDDFDYLDSWEDRYRYVIELGKALPPFPEEERTDRNKVQGCVSQVWLVTEQRPSADAPVLCFQGDSDAFIVKGLVALMLAAFSGKTAPEIVAFDAEGLLERLGLEENLSPQRANGLRALIGRMKHEAKSVQRAA